MKLVKLFAMVLAVTLVFSAGIHADNSIASKSSETASKSSCGTLKEGAEKYKSAQLVMEKLDGETIEQVSNILKEIPEVKSVKLDKEAMSLMVLHNAKLDFKGKVYPMIEKKVKGVSLKGIVDAKAPAKGKCAGCPSKSKCGGAKTTEKTTEKTSEAKTSCGGK